VTRPPLYEIPLSSAVPFRVGEVTVTMSIGQWDAVLQGMYDAGCVLLELDDEERPVAAYQRAAS
jgi:hypothetical protein